jgi:hypothetical protein
MLMKENGMDMPDKGYLLLHRLQGQVEVPSAKPLLKRQNESSTNAWLWRKTDPPPLAEIETNVTAVHLMPYAFRKKRCPGR